MGWGRRRSSPFAAIIAVAGICTGTPVPARTAIVTLAVRRVKTCVRTRCPFAAISAIAAEHTYRIFRIKINVGVPVVQVTQVTVCSWTTIVASAV